VGERTFGQGIVRSIVPLKDGVGSLKLPIASYFRPNGKAMNRYPAAKDSDDWGVTPDPGQEVSLTDEELNEFEKDRSARDVLGNTESPKSEFVDRQLQKAKEYFRTRLEEK